SEKVMLPQGTVKSALGYELELKQPEFINYGKGVRLHLPLNVKKGGSQFLASPDIYSERSQGGQSKRFVHPYIGRGLISDLYISPVDFKPGEKPHSENEIVLEKNKKLHFHDYELEFTGFDVSGMMGHQEGGTGKMSVGTNIVVRYKDEDPVTIKPTLTVGARKQNPSKRVKLPGPQEAYITLAHMNAGAKNIALIYEGPESSAQKAAARTPPTAIAEVSIKPGMTILWLGCFLILLGGSISVVRRRGK
ncbi:MAG: hypothetical protein JRF37_08760, partial [Deltaproteobacteria bacterium]|nr:hypothetical protein [Deltaproteobacteria bacterium]